jgi:hypothetical protein
VDERERVDHVRQATAGRDHQSAEHPTLHLLVRHLVRVVPEGPHLLGAEPVDVRAAHRHGVLRHAGDAVHRVRDVDAVPVQGHPVRHRLVGQPYLDQLPLLGPDDRTR